MFPKASEYLQPVQNFAKLCGTLPVCRLTDCTVTRSYKIYTLFSLVMMCYSGQKIMVNHFYEHRDIVCFTFLLTDTFYLAFHAAAILSPVVLKKVYFKLFKRFEQIEKLMHLQNIAQTQSISNFQLYGLILLALSSSVLFGYCTFDADVMSDFGLVSVHNSFLATTLHITSLLWHIKNKFCLLNWHLEYLNNKVPIYLLPHEIEEFMENKASGKHAVGKFVENNSCMRQVTAVKIKAFNQIHFLLYSSCNLISNYFSLQICLCVLSTALLLQCTFIDVFFVGYIDTLVEMTQIIVTCFNFIQILVIADIFHQITSEVSKRFKLDNAMYKCKHNLVR